MASMGQSGRETRMEGSLEGLGKPFRSETPKLRLECGRRAIGAGEPSMKGTAMLGECLEPGWHVSGNSGGGEAGSGQTTEGPRPGAGAWSWSRRQWKSLWEFKGGHDVISPVCGR